jgi:hypothetical protein
MYISDLSLGLFSSMEVRYWVGSSDLHTVHTVSMVGPAPKDSCGRQLVGEREKGAYGVLK